ncbi:PASTA domain-containing protein [Persephonella atlantica]|uniref:PASTA domain-containing protein n=1 Tax=Persephonella atlantica TaxID=2699429 RepID=A0ABS1GHI4_9AQUI|nr:PASTA domain-containing protein [Persephonella atlantica]MBK3332345.1 PASTA domain-containing protein [Persephonella atlantica]
MPEEFIRRLAETVERLEAERNSLRLEISNLERELSQIKELENEISLLKEKIVYLEEQLKKQPPKKKRLKKISINQFLNSINSSILEFERATKQVSGEKSYTISDITVELRVLVDLDDEMKIKVPDETVEISPEMLSKINFRLSPVVIEKEEEWIEVPNLVGLGLKEGEKLLKEKGLKYKVEKKESPYPENTIINQYPEPYTEVKKEVVIKLYVSKGKR